MKYILMLFLIGTFVASIAAAPSRSVVARDNRLNRMQRSTSAATAKAVLQALLQAERQAVFEQDEDDDGLEQDEDDDDDGDLMAAIENMPDTAQAQFLGFLKSLFG